jgi:hypothetical protein
MVYNLKLGPVSGALRLGHYKILFGKRFQKQGGMDQISIKTPIPQCRLFLKINQ